MKLNEGMKLDMLREASDEVTELRNKLNQAIRERDTLIKECSEFAKTSRLCRETGLTRTQIWRIAPGRS